MTWRSKDEQLDKMILQDPLPKSKKEPSFSSCMPWDNTMLHRDWNFSCWLFPFRLLLLNMHFEGEQNSYEVSV
ncbi:hypothetical protein A6R68_07285 [Neotoma lepida]|uniref:Uncharacterized protein n=1 Tax=Neotoma lepida TaxID=56216 RepID=A0A1A6GEI6_NEOLE|nr:hypothetical protein A6R68_07285 [Neotoma lepida]